jgi:hypothetical protein
MQRANSLLFSLPNGGKTMKEKKLVLVTALVVGLLFTGCSAITGGGEGEGGTEESATRSRPAPRPQPIVLPAGTDLDVRLSTGLSSKDNNADDPFEGTLEDPVVVGDRVAIPKGAEVKGKVTNAVKSGRLKQRAELWVTLEEIKVKGRTYQISTSTTGHKEGSKTTRNILFIGGGAGGGAAVGGATGGGKGAGVGAAIGAGAGTVAAVLTGKRDINFPPETLLRFELEEELKIQP